MDWIQTLIENEYGLKMALGPAPEVVTVQIEDLQFNGASKGVRFELKMEHLKPISLREINSLWFEHHSENLRGLG